LIGHQDFGVVAGSLIAHISFMELMTHITRRYLSHDLRESPQGRK